MPVVCPWFSNDCKMAGFQIGCTLVSDSTTLEPSGSNGAPSRVPKARHQTPWYLIIWRQAYNCWKTSHTIGMSPVFSNYINKRLLLGPYLPLMRPVAKFETNQAIWFHLHSRFVFDPLKLIILWTAWHLTRIGHSSTGQFCGSSAPEWGQCSHIGDCDPGCRDTFLPGMVCHWLGLSRLYLIYIVPPLYSINNNKKLLSWMKAVTSIISSYIFS